MDSSQAVLLSIPTCSISYKLYLDDLDLALLPMSHLMDKYGLGSSRSQLDGPKDGSSEKGLNGQSDEKLEDQSVGSLNGIPDCSVLEFKATAERREQHCVNETVLNKAKEERQIGFCDICNIAVPKMYAKDHRQSKLHTTLLRLANEAVGRLNRHIQQQLSEADFNCYCPTCNEEVESLENHENNIKHKLLKKREELLANLLELYTEDHGAYDERTRQIINKVDPKSSLDNPDTNDNSNFSAEKTEAVTNCVDAAATKPEVARKWLSEHDHIMEESFADLRNGVDNDNASIAKDAEKAEQRKREASVVADGGQPNGTNLVPQEPTPEGSFVVPDKLTQTQKDTNAMYYFCDTCGINLPNNITTIIAHLNCTSHKAKLDQTVEHVAGKKSLTKDADSANTNITSHILAHHDSASHGANLEQIHVAETKSVSKDTDTTGPYYCKICAVKVPNYNSNITEHNNGSAHKAKMEEVRSGRKGSTSELSSSLAPHKPSNQWLAGSGVVPHLAKAAQDAISTGYYFCSICSVKVPNNINNISAHNNGAAHRAKLENMQAAGKTIDPQKYSQVSSSALAKTSGSNQPTNSADQYYCVICAITIPNNPHSIILHVNGKAHLRKKDSTLDVNAHVKKGLAKVNDYCTVCGVTTGIGNFEQHLLSKSHKECVRSGKASDETVGSNLCQLCNFEMPNHHMIINAHYTGETHTINFKTYLAKNSIDNLTNNQIRCNVCLKSMHLSFVWGHVKNEQHVANLEKSEKDPDFCNVCKVDVGRNNMKVHVDGRAHKLNIEAQNS